MLPFVAWQPTPFLLLLLLLLLLHRSIVIDLELTIISSFLFLYLPLNVIFSSCFVKTNVQNMSEDINSVYTLKFEGSFDGLQLLSIELYQ